MNNIENRIVEMKFDNSQFEAAVAKTMDTLDKFKEKLNFENAGKGMDKLGKATGNYQYTLNDIGQSLDQLNGRFSNMGTIGRRVLENLTDAAFNFAKNGIGNMFSGITQGGLSRAMNLEQAKFQMQGIFKDAEKVRSVIYDDILPELQGTPYSLDQAAVVIGQLGASGIKSSEQIHQATRAIAGLAAMSGRGFDEVGRIFSKVAGQGNMMGGELQQLSTYGINAAANLVEYFKKVAKGQADASDSVKEHIAEIQDAYGSLDEASIRDAASKRMIYYEDMAAAMDHLYGEHAKKSTEMYTGALEDLRAALARIGAEPAAIGLEVLRNAFNALVPAVDAVNAVLKPFTNATKDVVKGADGDKVFGGQMYGTLAKEVQGLGISFANLFVRMDENGKVLRWNEENIARFATTLTDADGVVHHFAVSGQEIAEGDAIMNPHMWRTITAATQSFVNILKAFRSVLEPIAKGIAGAFPKLTLKTISNMAEAVRDFTSHLILSSENMERLKWITQGVFTPIGLVFRGLIQLIKAFIKVMGAVFNTVSPALNAIFAFASSIGKLVSSFGDFIIDLANMGLGFGKFVAGLIVGIAQFFRLDKVLNLIQIGFNKLATLFDLAGDKLSGLIGNTVPKVKEFVTALGELTHAKEIAGHISTLFENIKNSVAKALHIKEISAAFKEFTDSLKDLFTTDNLLGKLIENFKNFISFLSDLIPYETIVEKISGAFDRLATNVGKLTQKPAGAIKKFFKDRAKDIAEFIKNLDEGDAFERLARSLVKPYGAIKTFMSQVQKIVIPLIQNLISYIPKLFGFVTFGEMMASLGNKIKTTISEFLRFIGVLGELTQTQSEKKLASIRKSLQSFFGKTLTDKILSFNDSLSKAGSSIGEKLVTFGKSIGEALRNLNEKDVRKFVSTLALLALAWKYITVMRSAKFALEGFGKAFSGLGGLLNNFSSAFGIATINKAIASSIKLISLAASLMIFAGSIYILSKMNWQQILLGSAVMFAALLSFWSIMKVIEKMETADGAGIKIFNLAVSMAAIGAGVLLIAAAVKQVADVWQKSSPEQAVGAVLSIIFIMGAFGILVRALDGLDGKASALGKASFALIGIAQGMKVMAEAFAKFGEIDETSFSRGLEAVVLIMGLFSLFAFSVRAGAKVFGAATGMIVIASAMFLMQKAMAKFGEMKPNVIKQGGLVLGQILIGLMGFALVAGAAEKSILAAGIAMIAIGGAIHIIALAISNLGTLDADVFKQGALAIAAMLAAFVLFAAFAKGGALGGAAAILLLAAGIHILVDALTTLAEFNFGKLLNGLIKMIVVSAGLAVSIALLNGALKLIGAKDALKVTLLGTGLFLLANALGVLASVPIVALAIAILGLVAALAAVGLVMGLFTAISPGLLAVGAAFALLGVAALFVGAGLLFLTMALTSLIPLLLILATVDMGTLTQGLQVIKVVADGLSDAFISLAKGVAVFGLACLAAGIGLISIGAGLVIIGAGAIAASIGVALFAGALALLAITIQEFFGGNLLEIISGGFEAFASGFTGVFGKLWDKIIGDSGAKSKETRAAIDKGLSTPSGTDVQESLEQDPKQALADIMQWGPASYGNAGSELSEAMGSGYLDNGNPLTDSLTGQLGDFNGLIDSEGNIAYEKMANVGTLASNGFSNNLGGIAKSFQGLNTDANKQMGKFGQTLEKGSSEAARSMGPAISKEKGNVQRASETVVNAGKTAPRNAVSSWRGYGRDAASGYKNGMSSMINSIAAGAAAVVNAAKAAAKAAQNSNSPSKDFMKFGIWADQGYILGLNSLKHEVAKAAGGVVEGGLAAASKAIDNLSEALSTDIDFNPTISPVVDLTNVRKGAMEANSMFTNSSFGLSTPYTNYASAQMIARAFSENPMGSEFEAVAKLAKEIGNMTETMNSRQMINNIQIDGSEDPNAFADALTRRFKLNVRTM